MYLLLIDANKDNLNATKNVFDIHGWWSQDNRVENFQSLFDCFTMNPCNSLINKDDILEFINGKLHAFFGYKEQIELKECHNFQYVLAINNFLQMMYEDDILDDFCFNSWKTKLDEFFISKNNSTVTEIKSTNYSNGLNDIKDDNESKVIDEIETKSDSNNNSSDKIKNDNELNMIIDEIDNKIDIEKYSNNLIEDKSKPLIQFGTEYLNNFLSGKF